MAQAPRQKPPRTKPRPDAEVQRLARRHHALTRIKARAERWQKDVQGQLLDELAVRKVDRSLVLGDTQITRCCAATTVYDAAGLRKALKPRQRQAVITATANLNALPPQLRERMLAMLSPREVAAITTLGVDHVQLQREVEAGRISAEVAATHRVVTYGTPYIRVTDPALA
jgi:hypothetical protein